MVDLERRRPIDLLPDRSAETRAAWLRREPQTQLVARDRSAFEEARMPNRLTITVSHDLGATEVRRRIDCHIYCAFQRLKEAKSQGEA